MVIDRLNDTEAFLRKPNDGHPDVRRSSNRVMSFASYLPRRAPVSNRSVTMVSFSHRPLVDADRTVGTPNCISRKRLEVRLLPSEGFLIDFIVL